MYIDALIDRDKDVIPVVERVDGKRVFREYPARYLYYYKDSRGSYESIFGDKLHRVVTTSGKQFKKEKTKEETATHITKSVVAFESLRRIVSVNRSRTFGRSVELQCRKCPCQGF